MMVPHSHDILDAQELLGRYILVQGLIGHDYLLQVWFIWNNYLQFCILSIIIIIIFFFIKHF